MANPVIVTCTADTWIKVLTEVTTAVIHRLSLAPNVYKQTYVVTTDPAPTDDSTAALMFSKNPNEEEVSSAASVDVYVKAVKVAGSVRVDA